MAECVCQSNDIELKNILFILIPNKITGIKKKINKKMKKVRKNLHNIFFVYTFTRSKELKNILLYINKVSGMGEMNKLFRWFAWMFVVLTTLSCSNEQTEKYFLKDLNENWLIQNAESVAVSGEKISASDFQPAGWYSAEVPSTVLHTLVENGVYKDIYRDDNLEKIPAAIFKKSWWYRTQFDLNTVPEVLLLHLEGINYKANIWLNGNQIADTGRIKNTFRQFRLNISDFIHEGKNTLAIEVFPPRPGDFSIGFVDWNPEPPDRNMGLFRRVYLEANAGVGLSEPFIVSELNKELTEATLTASVEVTNYHHTDLLGEVILKVNGKKLVKPVTLIAGKKKKVVFSADDFPELKIKDPELWWPHTLGNPHLYHADFEFHESGIGIDKKSIDFGIRTVSSFFTKSGSRGFKINGEKILIRGGGWVDRLLLDDTPESIQSQLEYVKDMNLNTIRLEGFWGKDQTMYNLCDRMGILVMVGWSCQWEWEDYLGKPTSEEYGGILTSKEIDMMSRAWQDQIVWLRNHPSIFTWMGGSDCKPKPELEKKYFEIFSGYDSTRVYLASAKEWTSLAGPTGVKMRGPYAYEPPVYWFSDTLYGGAFGFNTETGPGAQVPPLESIKKMISPQHLWPIDKIWDYHCGRNEFNTLDRYTRALEARYGKAENVEDYAKKAQVMNYELMRPMLEAFSAYRYKATGVIQWMLNSAWPEMYWQLYDYYLMPNGAYYGAKKASQSRHVIYDYAHNSLYAVNDKLEAINNCRVKIQVFDNRSVLKFEKELPVDLPANASSEIFSLPEFNRSAPLYFLDVRLYDSNGKELDNNFYWLSAKKDILDYQAEVPGWYYHTPSKQYADLTALNRLPEVRVTSDLKLRNGNDLTIFEVTLKNESNTIAFFLNPAIRDKKTGQTILPVLWSDNYVSLLPGETRTLTAKIGNSNLKDKNPELVVKGYNLKEE